MNPNFQSSKNLSTLTGQLLVAMPQLQDPRFSHGVIYICGHDNNGAMGIVLNKVIDSLYLKDLLKQMEVDDSQVKVNCPIHYGGPVEMGRGFVIHSTDYQHETSVKVSPTTSLTATLDLLKLIGQNEGPKEYLIALGYAGWSPKQLEAELHDNSWLIVEPDNGLIYAEDATQTWHRAIRKLGIDPDLLSADAGHA